MVSGHELLPPDRVEGTGPGHERGKSNGCLPELLAVELVNRRRRRELDQRGVEILVATRSCDRCGAPYCPRCDEEAMLCSCCGEMNCDRCGAYVLPAASSS
jgi:hypothetical protein